MRLKRFFHLLEILQDPQVVGEFAVALRYTSQRIQNLCVHLSGIGLAGYRNHFIKSHGRGDKLIQLLNFLLIDVKQFYETGLRAGSSFGAQQAEIL